MNFLNSAFKKCETPIIGNKNLKFYFYNPIFVTTLRQIMLRAWWMPDTSNTVWCSKYQTLGTNYRI